RCVGGNGDPAGRHQVIRVGGGVQAHVGRFDHVGQALGAVVTLGSDLDRLMTEIPVFRAAEHAAVDGPAVRDVADGVDDLPHADLLEVLPVDQHLLAAGVDVHHGGVVGRDQGPASPLQACAHVVRLALAHCRVTVLLAAPASQAST